MDLNDKFHFAKKYADLAMELLQRYDIPPTPINYSVFYLHANGSNPELSKQLTNKIKKEHTLDSFYIESLFIDYVSNSEQVKNSVMTPLSDSIGDLVEQIENQVAQDEEAVVNLEKVDKFLTEQNDEESLGKVMSFLVRTVNKSKEQHQSLSKQLTSTKDQVTELKEKLEMARQDAISDALTGLLNRRGCEEKLAQLDIEETHCSLAIDIDHFKSINDNFGHFIGDKVLQRVANSIKTNIDESDIAVRYGGEEFVVVTVNKTKEEAKTIAENIRLSVMNLKLKQKNSKKYLPQISVSVGVAENKPGESDWQTLFNSADQALYQAKNAGRNRTIIAA